MGLPSWLLPSSSIPIKCCTNVASHGTRTTSQRNCFFFPTGSWQHRRMCSALDSTRALTLPSIHRSWPFPPPAFMHTVHLCTCPTLDSSLTRFLVLTNMHPHISAAFTTKSWGLKSLKTCGGLVLPTTVHRGLGTSMSRPSLFATPRDSSCTCDCRLSREKKDGLWSRASSKQH